MEAQLLIGAVVVLVAVAASRLGSQLGLPSLLLFLGLGVLMGDAALGIRFSDANLAHHLGFAALVLILAEGGFTTKWREIRPALALAGLLATVGMVVSVALVACFAHYVLGLSWTIGILVGAILSPTDSAAVFSVLRKVPLPKSITAALEAESGLNDAPTVILVTLTTAMALGHGPEGGAWSIAGLAAFELAGGIAIGLGVGALGVTMLRTIALPSSGLYPLATLSWAILAYGLGWWLHTSGFASVYVCAVLLGNAGLPHRTATRSFFEGIGWIAQIGLFVMLGLLASPRTFTWADVVMAVAVGGFLTLVARPLSVALCALPFRVPWRNQVFLSWAGLRGAVPIILATIPLAGGVPHAQRIFAMVFVFVILSTLAQGPTLPALARLLRLEGTKADAEIELEVAPLQKVAAELVHSSVPPGSRLHGVSVQELRLPARAVVSLIVRDGESFVPAPFDVIRARDQLLVVTPASVRGEVEARLRELDRSGRLAQWRNQAPTAGSQPPRRWRREPRP